MAETPVASTFRHSLIAILLVCLAIPLAAQNDSRGAPVGQPIDWSSRHIIHGAGVSPDMALTEPRATYNWLLRHRNQGARAAAQSAPTKKQPMKVDWSFPLGGGTVPASMYPAKYSFDASSTTLTAANCTSDYLVYALNILGSSSQPNLVRFNNIYAGTGGLCGANPTVLSAYNINTLDQTGLILLNGVLKTSPALSLDGTKVAFIETVTSAANRCPGLPSPGSCSIFHVLTFGTTGTNGSWDSTNHVYNAVTPGGTNNASITTLAYSGTTNTFSSPWIDYRPGPTGDHAYFGNDNGQLYRTNCVFYCATPPVTDTGWPILLATNIKLGPPVYDSVSNKVFVGGSNGILYLVDLALCPGTNCTVAGGGIKTYSVGSANAFGGVVDAPLVDSTFQTVFAFSGDNGAGAGTLAQTDTSFSANVNIKYTFGSPAFLIYSGALDNAYYQNVIGGATVGGNLFSCGSLGGSGQPDLYWVPFTMNAGTLSTSNPPRLNTAGPNPKNKNIPGNNGIGCTPLTEFVNGATDRVFFSQSQLNAGKCVTGSLANDGCMMMYDITPPISIGTSPTAAAEESAGTSAVIVDNASASGQASSIYFANQGTAQCTTGVSTPSFCAVKLTQSLLQ